MTVLFCDLEASTGHARDSDPDDLLEALRRYQRVACEIAARFGGYIARMVGDGVDIYFGYPTASEDDAVRAVLAALWLAKEVPRIETGPDRHLRPRMGVATGLVAVSLDQGVAVAGSTPNLAARIQAVVPPGCVGVAPATRRIAEGPIEFQDFGVHALKGFEQPLAISLARRANRFDSRSAWRGSSSRHALVNRESELAAMLAAWQRAAAGCVLGILVSGEAGLGKSRLVGELQTRLPAQGHSWLHVQGSPLHINSVLQPFIAHLTSAAGFDEHDSAGAQLDKLEAQLAVAGLFEQRERALLATLLGLPVEGRYPPLDMPPPLRLQLTKEALRRYFVGLTGAGPNGSPGGTRPLLLVIEDMHWIDPTSVELVNLLLSERGAAPITLVMTARPAFKPAWPADCEVLHLPLERLDDAAAEKVARLQSQGAELPPESLAMIVERTDGVPLFIEEMTRLVLVTRTKPREVTRTVPGTLMDLLTARLDRLPAAGKLAAQLAAVIGREFDRRLLFSLDRALANQLAEGLAALLDSEIVLPNSADGERMWFKHALILDAAYASLPPKRRVERHGQVAAALLSGFADRVSQQPEVAALHLTRAGQAMDAARWWQAAGAQALSRGAPREAAAHLRAGLDALAAAEAGVVRDTAELGLLSMLGPTTMVLRGPGDAEFGAIQQRAYNLTRQLPGCRGNWRVRL